MRKFDIVVAGDFNIDLLYNGFPHIPAVGEEVVASGFEIVLGSSAGITASHLASLGAKVAFIGVVGDDIYGRQLIDLLAATGVSTDYVKVRKGQKTGNTVVMNRGDDRANLTYSGAMATLCEDDFPFDVIADTPFFHLSNPFVLPGVLPFMTDLFKRIKKQGSQTSLVPQWDVTGQWNLDFANLLPNLDFFFPNQQELMLLTRSDTFEAAIKTVLDDLKHQVIMTMGRAGATVLTPEGQTKHPGYVNENPVDCVGAGDAFTAGYLIAKMEGRSNEGALEMAGQCGALSTFCHGGGLFCQNRADFNEKSANLLL